LLPVKNQVALGHSEGLWEVHGNTALYRAVTQWVEAFVRIRMLLGIISMVTTHKNLLLKSLLEVNMYWMTCQLAVEEGINDKSMHHLFKNLFWICKISSHWVQYHFTVV
jgi:hypothetical protein